MFRVEDIYDEAKKIVGVCDDAKLFRWCGDVVSIIANKGDFEGFKAWLDICTSDTSDCGSECITLPREVETVIAVNIGGHPSLGFGTLFNFHLNGMGDCRTACRWTWQDQGGWHCIYKDLTSPKKLVVQLQTAEDNGKKFIVYGYDSAGNKLRRQVDGIWLDGYQVPTIYGLAVPDSTAPVIARITGIFKESSVGSMKLSTQDNILLGVYEPDEEVPQLRRIKINRKATWVRIAYMKTNPSFSSRFDHIPLRSRIGFLLGMQARKHYADKLIAEAHAFEADAARLELEAQQKAEPNTTVSPIQVMDGSGSLIDKDDFDIR